MNMVLFLQMCHFPLRGSRTAPWPKQNYSKALLQGLFMVTEVVAGTCRNQVAITHSKALLLIKANNTILVSEQNKQALSSRFYKSRILLIFFGLIGRLLLMFLAGLSSVVSTTSFPLFIFLCNEQRNK
jgi:hypothetical protein